MQVVDQNGKNIGGQQSEIDFMVFSTDRSLPPEIVSAKMNGRQVAPKTDLSNLENFYKLDTTNPSDVKAHFGNAPVYRNASGVNVKYTDVSTGEIKAIPLEEFRRMLPEPHRLENGRYDLRVKGLTPDDRPPKPGIEHVKLGIDHQPLLDNVLDTIDKKIGNN